MKRLILGCGQTGSRLAEMFRGKEDEIITFSTAIEDTFGLTNNIEIAKEGSGRNYNLGIKLWAQNKDKLEEVLGHYERRKVIYFASLAGGSGSSSIKFILNTLLKHKNKIMFIGILPFLSEAIPATANTVRAMQKLNEYSDRISIMLFSNEEISKVFGRDYTAINNHIIGSVSCVANLTSNLNDPDLYTPLSIDELEADSIAYSSGFLNVSFSNLEEESPKFIGYGKINEARNILIIRSIYSKIKNEEVDKESSRLVEIVKKISKRAKNARLLYGIIRNNFDNLFYITIASGFSIGKLISKYKDYAIDRVTNYRQETEKVDILTKDEDKFLNV